MNLQTFYYINDNCIYDDNGLILNYYDKPPEALIDFCINKTGRSMPENCSNIFDILFYMTNIEYNSDDNNEQDNIYEDNIYEDNISEDNISEYNYENIEDDDIFSYESNEWINIE